MNKDRIQPSNFDHSIQVGDALKQAKNYYNHCNYYEAIEIIENLDYQHHNYKTLTLLGNCYQKTQLKHRILYLAEKKWHQPHDPNAQLMLLIVDLASKSRYSNDQRQPFHQGEFKLGANTAITLDKYVHDIFFVRKDLKMQYFLLQRYESLKNIYKQRYCQSRLSIFYYKLGYAVIRNEWSDSFNEDHWLSKFIKKTNIPHIVNSFIVCAKNASNYYHFVAECLPCYCLADSLLPKSVAFVVQSLNCGENIRDRYHDFHVQMLSSLFPDRVIQRIDIGTEVKLVNSYTMLSLPSMVFATDSIKKLTFKLNSQISNETYKPEIIYIKRGEGEGRNLENEDRLLNILNEFPGKYLILSTLDYSWKQQIELIRNAKVIISSHGAQITTSIFSIKLKKIIELWPKKILQPRYFCEDFCDNYHWIKSSFLNDTDTGHRSAHKLTKLNLDHIHQLLSEVEW
tara:strand:+ start:3624 stop:4988 length:1365 start_codon:yes stop_codon:yes gene_type:complete